MEYHEEFEQTDDVSGYTYRIILFGSVEDSGFNSLALICFEVENANRNEKMQNNLQWRLCAMTDS